MKPPYALEYIQQAIDCGAPQLRISRMSQLPPCRELETQRPFGRQAQLVLRRLTVNQITRAPWHFCCNTSACAISLLANYKQQAQVRNTFKKEFLDGTDH